jgi:GntR family transcriptional regulator, transcriptional repressor for pyruvate dehydrogenase complex
VQYNPICHTTDNADRERNVKMGKKAARNPFDSLVVSSRTNISIRLFEEIKEKIVSGEMPAGYVFPNEIVLSEKLKVGRTTLREAFQALASMGLIKRTKNGTFVEDRKNIAGSTPLSELFKQSEIDDLLEFRIMVEAEIAALAAVRATDEDIATLEQCIVNSEASQGNIAELIQYDTKFHTCLGEASKNQLFVKTIQVIENQYESVLKEIYEKDKKILRRAQAFHRKILSAIKEHDALKARDASHQHIVDVIKTVTQKRA